MNQNFESIKTIYDALADDESRYIFGNRLLFSLTGDEGYIEKVIRTTSEGVEFYRKLEETNTRKVIFGAGFWGQELVRQYHKYGFDCFVDNKAIYPWEEKAGLVVISFDEYLEKYRDSTVFLGSRLYYKELYAQLVAHGIAQDRIVNVGKMIDDMSLRQYFDLPCMPHVDEEVFVDAGGFDGKTTKLFIEWCNNCYNKIYISEPEKDNIIKIRNNLTEWRVGRKLDNQEAIEIIPYGLWDQECMLEFTEQENGASHVVQKTDKKRDDSAFISVRPLDHIISGDVSFIKMDIEGAEYKAIKGAEQLIKRCKPKLAVSIYHKVEDIWELPKLLLHICPDYRLYLRHYSIAQAETVLYAI